MGQIVYMCLVKIYSQNFNKTCSKLKSYSIVESTSVLRFKTPFETTSSAAIVYFDRTNTAAGGGSNFDA